MGVTSGDGEHALAGCKDPTIPSEEGATDAGSTLRLANEDREDLLDSGASKSSGSYTGKLKQFTKRIQCKAACRCCR